ncbi:MAG: fatty acid desaturase [Verrucomicrobiales bacterium]|jgi:fatty acid desaturase
METEGAAEAKQQGRFWNHSPIDILFVGYVVAFLIGMGVWLWYFDRLGLGWNIAIGVVAGLGHFYNYIVVNHEFMHTPPFRSKWLNLAMNTLSSVTLVYWMSLIDDGHKLHHAFNNDPKRGGKTKDPTSTWLKGRNGQQEPLLSYILLNFIRVNLPGPFMSVVRSVWTKKNPWPRRQFICESIALALTLGVVIAINPWFLIPMVLFSYVGWVLTDMQNYYEHYRAGSPGTKYANSVSYYGKFYNIMMFNEGYHQEHHLRPTAHWTERPQLREKYRKEMEDAGHYVSKVPLSLGFLDRSPPPPPSPDESESDALDLGKQPVESESPDQ